MHGREPVLPVMPPHLYKNRPQSTVALSLMCLLMGSAIFFHCPRTTWAYLNNKRPESPCTEKLLDTERLLLAQGYRPGPLDGCPDAATDFAILAFRRVHRLRQDEGFTPALMRLLRTGKSFRPQDSNGPHLEINLTRKLMYWVGPQGAIQTILPVSIGSGESYKYDNRVRLAVTPRGTFSVYRKIGDWHYSPLGMMYYSSYITGGIAIHGSRDFSPKSRTHGCIAIPMYAASEVYNLLPIGTRIVIYRDELSSRKQPRKR
jgi:hypothetical protein